MADFEKTTALKEVNTVNRRYLPAGMLSVVILLFLSSLHNNIYAQNPYLHFAFNTGSAASDNGESVVTDHSGNIYMTGYFTGTADFDPGPGVADLIATGTNSNVFIAKYTAGGSYQWAFSIPNSGTFGDGHSIFVDGAGNIYVTGSFTGTADFDPGTGTANLSSNGSTDIFIAKYNPAGNYQWAFDIGGIDPDFGYSITADASGNIYVTGDFENTVDFDPGPGTANLTATGTQDIFVAKYNAAGNYQWAFNIGTASASNEGLSVGIDGASNIYITGTFYGTVDFDPGPGTADLTSNGANDIYLAKYNSSGVYQWAFNVGGGPSDVGYSVAIDIAGNVFLSGYFQGPADFDPGPGIASLSGSGAFLAKYNAAGNYQWAFPINYSGVGGSINIGTSISTDASGSVFLTGRFSNTADFNPGAGIANLTATGQTDIFVAKYNSSGLYQWAFDIGGLGVNVGCSIAADDLGGIYVTGNFKGTADFDPRAGVTNLSSISGSSDIFLAKYSPCPVAAGPGPITGNVSVCVGTNNTYSIDPVPGAISYTWNIPAGWAGSSATTSINVVTGNSSGVISVVANNICGPTYQQLLAVTVNPVLTVNVGLYVNPSGITCPGKPVTFTAINIGTAPASNYEFKVNGLTQQSGTSTTYTTTTLADGDVITCTVTVTGACLTVTSAVSNAITASVPSSTPAVSISTTSPARVCEGIPVQFSAIPANLGGSTVINYDFKINGGIEQSGNSPIFNWASLYGGDITCTIRVIGGACITTNTATSNSIPLVVDPIPVISFNPPDQTITIGNSTPLNPNISVSGGSYLWTPFAGLNDPALMNPLAGPTTTTTYNLHFVSAGGCIADKKTTIKVFNDIYIPNAFVPNGNPLNRVFRIPPGTSLQLEYLSIYDRLGNKVFSTSNINEGWDGTYKGKNCPVGTYVYMIRGTDFRGEVVRKGTLILIR